MPFAQRFLLAAALLVLVGCSKTIDDGGSDHVDFSNPKRVVSSIFFAARTGRASHLASLCDPEGSANQYAKRICHLQVGDADWASFVENFAEGTLTGEPRITGDRAMINFAFGKSGNESETMELVRRDGRWFLVAF